MSVVFLLASLLCFSPLNWNNRAAVSGSDTLQTDGLNTQTDLWLTKVWSVLRRYFASERVDNYRSIQKVPVNPCFLARFEFIDLLLFCGFQTFVSAIYLLEIGTLLFCEHEHVNRPHCRHRLISICGPQACRQVKSTSVETTYWAHTASSDDEATRANTDIHTGKDSNVMLQKTKPGANDNVVLVSSHVGHYKV